MIAASLLTKKKKTRKKTNESIHGYFFKWNIATKQANISSKEIFLHFFKWSPLLLRGGIPCWFLGFWTEMTNLELEIQSFPDESKNWSPLLPNIIPKKTCFSNVLEVAILGCGGTCEENKQIHFFNEVRKAYQTSQISKVSASFQLSTVFSWVLKWSSGHPDK